jgi:hypothetical protein
MPDHHSRLIRPGFSKNEKVNRVNQGILVPQPEDIESVDLSEIKWVLVVEKEARDSSETPD